MYMTQRIRSTFFVPTRTPKLEIWNPNPETRNPKPEPRNPKSRTQHPNLNPEIWNPESETWNPEPGTRNPKSEIRNPNPETRILKSKTQNRNLEPGTRNPEPGTRTPEPGTRNPKSEPRNPNPETQNLEPRIRNPEPRIHSKTLIRNGSDLTWNRSDPIGHPFTSNVRPFSCSAWLQVTSWTLIPGTRNLNPKPQTPTQVQMSYLKISNDNENFDDHLTLLFSRTKIYYSLVEVLDYFYETDNSLI